MGAGVTYPPLSSVSGEQVWDVRRGPALTCGQAWGGDRVPFRLSPTMAQLSGTHFS